MKRTTLLALLLSLTGHLLHAMGEFTITTGSPNIPVILVAFNDCPFSETDPHTGFYNRLCRPATLQEVENRQGSAYQYFADQSHGLFMPNFVIIGPVTLENSYAYYGENDSQGSDYRAGEMVKEAIEKAETANLVENWKTFDNDNDGKVDVVYILYAGDGENMTDNSNLIWPHQATLTYKGITTPTIDGITFEAYGCNSELTSGALSGFGSFCHEFSHCLGLPDFYPTNGAAVFGMDFWSVMGHGCYKEDGYIPMGYTASEKAFFGWLPLFELTTASSIIDLKSTANGGSGIKVVNDVTSNEYYVLEVIDNTGWNKGCYAEGILITHVNYKATAWQNNTVNNNAKMPGMSVIPADNDVVILQRGTNDEAYATSLQGDLWPGTTGNTALTDTSTPAALVYNGLDGYMRKPITNLSYDQANRTASFDFMGGGGNPLSISPTVIASEEDTTWYRLDGTPATRPFDKGIYIQKTNNRKTRKVIQQ